MSTNNSGRRSGIYRILDTAYAIEALDSMSLSELNKVDSYKCIIYSTELMNQALKQSGDTSNQFFIGLNRLGLAYHNWLRDDSIALYCLKQAMGILKDWHTQLVFPSPR